MIFGNQGPSSDTEFKVASRQVVPPSRRVLLVRLLLLLGFALLGVAWGLSGDLFNRPDALQTYTVAQSATLRLDPMLAPASDDLRALPIPEPAAIQEHEENAVWLERHPEFWDNLDPGLSPRTLAWFFNQLPRDERDPPPLRGFEHRDILTGRIDVSTNVWVRGTLLTTATIDLPGVGRYEASCVELAPEQYAIGIGRAAPTSVFIGERVSLVGRYLGTQVVTVDGTDQRMPVIGTRSIVSVEQEAQDDLPADILTVVGELPYRQGEVWEHDDAAFESIDDQRPVLELRPYYYLLGRVLRDLDQPRVFEGDAPRLNQIGSSVHRNPSAYRDEVVEVRGTVIDVFEDYDVAHVQPFGVDRVVRVWMVRRDYSPFTRTTYPGGVATEVTENRLVERAFELAIIVTRDDQLIPSVGDDLVARGRFLKMHGYVVNDIDEERDAYYGYDQRHSDHAYFFTLVVPPGQYGLFEPDLIDWTPYHIAFLVVCLSFFACMAWLIFRDHRSEDRLKEPIRELRAGRQKRRRGKGQADDADHNQTDGVTGSADGVSGSADGVSGSVDGVSGSVDGDEGPVTPDGADEQAAPDPTEPRQPAGPDAAGGPVSLGET